MEVLLDKEPSAKTWTSNAAETFVILKKGTNVAQFQQKIAPFLQSRNPTLHNFTLFVQQYSAKYLHGHYVNGVPAGGRITYVRIFSVVALFLLLIACVNYMNLSTAKSAVKMKEIGVRKAIGATRKNLIGQFLGESLLTAFLSLLVALLLVVLFLPTFNQITGKHLSLALTIRDVFVMLGIVLFTGLCSGSYPAFYLSGIKPLVVLKGKLPLTSGALWVRKGLVIFQFTLSILFMVGLLVMQNQIKLTQTINLGYDRDNILSLPWKGELYDQWNGLLEGKSNARFETFMRGIKEVPGVVNATNMSGNILNEIYGQSGVSWRGQEADRNYLFQSPVVGYDFIETLGIELVAGRSFSREYQDDYSKVIVNEAAAKLMALPKPVGTTIDMNGRSQIIGVVKDFHYGSLHNAVEPLIFRFDPTGRNVMVKIKAGSERETVKQLKKFYNDFLPNYAFDFTFLDADYQALYDAESRVATLSNYFAGLAILISCLGLFGLAAFTAERRRKEIGVRKVLGASSWSIVYLLSSDFTKLVGLAICVSLPISYLLVQKWLANFESRIDLHWGYFLGAGFVALVIAWLTVGLQAVKAAAINPAHSLKDE